MTDDDEFKKIRRMSKSELLDWVMGAPYYLTDPYYRSFATEIRKRYDKLNEQEAACRRRTTGSG